MFDPEPSDDFDDADDADINDNDNDNDDDNDDDDNDDDDDGIFGECDSADKRRTAAGQSKPLLTSIACNPLKSIACTFNPFKALLACNNPLIIINTPSCQISGGNQKELKEEPAQRQLQKTSLPNTPQSPAPTQKRGTTWIHLLWLKMANSVFGNIGYHLLKEQAHTNINYTEFAADVPLQYSDHFRNCPDRKIIWKLR